MFPDLHQQFLLFSKFGETGSNGSQIKLTQSDKWMRQAKVIEGWNVTITDTAIAFRKISRGSIWLEYNPWREFLEELTSRKGLDMREVTNSNLAICILSFNLVLRWWTSWRCAASQASLSSLDSLSTSYLILRTAVKSHKWWTSLRCAASQALPPSPDTQPTNLFYLKDCSD